MLALCFLFKGLENQCLQHLDTRRWFPKNSFRLHLILREEERTCYKAKMWLVDGVFLTSPKRKPHTLRKEKMYTCLSNKTKQMETLEEDKAAKNIATRLTNTHCQISFSLLNLIFIQYWNESILTQGKAPGGAFSIRQSLSPMSALTTLQTAQPLGRAKTYVSAFTLSLNIWAFKK